MKSIEKGCLLCNQPVEIPGFKLETKDGQQSFCCEGCLSIYRLLNSNKLLPPINERKK
ncbi:MAG: metal-binding protein [Methylococcales symbiont of Hymedesmia sp. n. MRB-2018]|nr:MAG: metal-binding protein [Methylococcales symbiont of Hymedesmia sp. n. MRB-2018]